MPTKIYPNWDFWFENKPSGYPEREDKIFSRQSVHFFLITWKPNIDMIRDVTDKAIATQPQRNPFDARSKKCFFSKTVNKQQRSTALRV
jgi:hypothetical protein